MTGLHSARKNSRRRKDRIIRGEDDLGFIKRRDCWCDDGDVTPAAMRRRLLVDDDGGSAAGVTVQSRKPVLTSFSRKNLTSPSSESLIPMDFSIPRSPFSTAMKTARRCSRSERIRCNAAPKSSIVCDSDSRNRSSGTRNLSRVARRREKTFL